MPPILPQRAVRSKLRGPLASFHRARAVLPFYLGQHEVTMGQFRKFVAESKHDAGTGWQNAFPCQTDDHPVVNV